MADIVPFRGIRYAGEIALDGVVAPPYDVLTEEQAAGLRSRSPYNAVHVDLPVGPGDVADEAAYDRAAARFSAWREEGVLARDDRPAVYLIEQTYRGPDGVERTRRGFVARLRLASFDERVVLQHERTHESAKQDRLRLYRAVHADLSQIFLLFADDDGSVARSLEAAAAGADPALARAVSDGDGNVHRITPVFGAAAERVTAGLREQPVYIADGHHRYETAVAYRDERRRAGDHSADTLMVYLCGMNDPGLMVFPTHRLLRDVATPPSSVVLERLDGLFDVVGGPVTGIAAAERLLNSLGETPDGGPVFGLYFADEDVCVTVKSREPAAQESLLSAGFSHATACLPVTILHELILSRVLGADQIVAERHISYAKSVPDAMAALAGGGFTLGAFLNATLVRQVRAVADAGEVMPQKSTYFYPKLLTGLVFDALGE